MRGLVIALTIFLFNMGLAAGAGFGLFALGGRGTNGHGGNSG